jgi:hypothetical protein
MSDEKLSGPRVYELGVAESIRRGLLSDFRVVVVGVSDTQAHKLVMDNAPLLIGPGQADASVVAVQVALAQAARAAFNLGQLTAAGMLTEAEVTLALTAAAAQTGLPGREITRTIKGGMAAGERSPRQAPPPTRTPELQAPRQRSQGPLPHR